ncbi:uracil DNA N-glycosylase Thp1 [Coemansia sp. RSA 2049]|nr:uracil DNA N-glycosylase Thp1 [Coemansia sp. RSA 2049]
MPKRSSRGPDSAIGSELQTKAPTPKVSSASSPKRQKRPSPDEIAGFQPIPELLRPNLDVLFVGINPGVVSGQKQLHFGNPQNYFWRGLYQSGLVPEEMRPEDGSMLSQRWNMSIVNLVQRTTPSTSDLSRKEMREAVPELCRKIRTCCPKIICFVGKGIYEAFVGYLRFDLGLQPEVYDLDCKCDLTQNQQQQQQLPPLRQLSSSDEIQCAGTQPAIPSFAYIFVMPSTSGRAAAYRIADKLQYFRQLKHVRDCAVDAAAQGVAPSINHDLLDSLDPRQVVRSTYFSQTKKNK